MADSIQQDAVGVVFRYTLKDQDGAAVNVAGASDRKIVFRRPDGATITKDATITSGGTDGRLQYTTVAGDLSVAGQWLSQVYLVGVLGFTGYSSPDQFAVEQRL